MHRLRALPLAALAAGFLTVSAAADPRLEDIGGDAASGSPSVVHWGNAKQDRVSVFIRGDNNSLWWRTRTNGRWNEWQDVGGDFLTSPTCAAVNDDVITCVAVGGDDKLYFKAYGQSNGRERWTKWEPGGGADPAPGTSVGFTTVADGGTLIAVRESNDQLSVSTMKESEFRTISDTERDALATDPACDARPAGSIKTEVIYFDCFAMVEDDFYHIPIVLPPQDIAELTPFPDMKWVKVGGKTADRAAPVWVNRSSLYVFVTGTDDRLWQAKFEGKQWKWTDLGGRFDSAPGCDARPWDNPKGTIYCAFRDDNGSIQFSKIR